MEKRLIEIESYIVELEDGVFLTDGNGDPSRTLCFDYARFFTLKKDALSALDYARTFRPFKNAKVLTVVSIHSIKEE